METEAWQCKHNSAISGRLPTTGTRLLFFRGAVKESKSAMTKLIPRKNHRPLTLSLFSDIFFHIQQARIAISLKNVFCFVRKWKSYYERYITSSSGLQWTKFRKRYSRWNFFAFYCKKKKKNSSSLKLRRPKDFKWNCLAKVLQCRGNTYWTIPV